MEMSYYSIFAGEYEAIRKNNAKIIASQIALQAVQVIVGVLASNFATFAVKPSQYIMNYQAQGGFWNFLGDIGGEMFQELILEEAISNAASVFGASSGLANFLGEAISSGIETAQQPGKVAQNKELMQGYAEYQQNRLIKSQKKQIARQNRICENYLINNKFIDEIITEIGTRSIRKAIK